MQGKIFHTFPQVKGLKNEEKFPFTFTRLQKMYFWRLKYAFQTKYIFWENLQFLCWHLYFKKNDENCLNVLIWSQKIYFWSQNYTSQTIYFFLEILQQHPCICSKHHFIYLYIPAFHHCIINCYRWGLWNLGQRLQSQKKKITFFFSKPL